MKIIFYAIMVMIMVTIVSAASFVAPVDGQTVDDRYKFRAKAAFDDVDYCDIVGTSVDAGDSISFRLRGETGTSGMIIYASEYVDTTAMTDASDWEFSGTCTYLDGNKEPIEPLNNIIVDNTKPVLDVKQFDRDETDWQFLCLGANSGQVSLGGNTYPLKVKGALCTFDAGSAPQGDFNILVSITDGKDKSELLFKNVDKTLQRDPDVIQSLLIQEAQKKKAAEEAANAPPPAKNGMPLLIAITILTVLVIIIAKAKGKNE